LSALGLFLCWLVATTSVPYALAPYDPDLALRLNPSNPAALIAKAEGIRAQLLSLRRGPKAAASDEEASHDTIGVLPASEQSALPERDDRYRLREEIRSLALRTLQTDPLNATAFRLLGEIADTPDQVRILMGEAERRSRRDAIAQAWLLNDSFLHGDFKSALGHAELLLQGHPELSAYVFGYLARLAEDPVGRGFLIPRLARNPFWRVPFFQALPWTVRRADTPLKLMLALKETAAPLSHAEYAPYLDMLIGRNLVDVAYNAWLQYLPQTEAESVRFITHPNFEREPSGLAFDWRVDPGLNASADFVPLAGESGRALHVNMGDGRVQFPEVKQVVLFAAGSYRLDGKLRGQITGKRGLRWQVRCAHGSQRVVGETDMLVGRSQQWRNFTFTFDVPETDECKGQVLRVFHDARSPSEEFISGEVWFSDLRLTRALAAEVSEAVKGESAQPADASTDPVRASAVAGWTVAAQPLQSQGTELVAGQ